MEGRRGEGGADNSQVKEESGYPLVRCENTACFRSLVVEIGKLTPQSKEYNLDIMRWLLIL